MPLYSLAGQTFTTLGFVGQARALFPLPIPVEQHSTLVLSFVMLLLTIMLCVAPQLLFPATLTASIDKEAAE